MVYSSTASTCCCVTPGNHDRKSSIEAPPSRFSNNAITGTRVLRKTHEPLTFSGPRSTTEHEDQSIINERYLFTLRDARRANNAPLCSRASAPNARVQRGRERPHKQPREPC